MKQPRLAFASLTIFATLAGCSDPIPVLSSSGSTGSGSSATSGAGGASSTTGTGSLTFTSSAGAGGFGGGTSSTSDGVGGGEPLGPFECHGCICDGLTHYCYTLHSGGLPPPGPPPEPLCVDPAPVPYAACLPMPAKCIPAPSCACLGADPGICQHIGAGFTIDANPP